MGVGLEKRELSKLRGGTAQEGRGINNCKKMNIPGGGLPASNTGFAEKATPAQSLGVLSGKWSYRGEEET